jgi:hypothetical protein
MEIGESRDLVSRPPRMGRHNAQRTKTPLIEPLGGKTGEHRSTRGS